MRGLLSDRPSRAVCEQGLPPVPSDGHYKWQQLGLDYTLSTTEAPSPEVVASAVGIFRAAGLNAS
jgi:hypothetical protein